MIGAPRRERKFTLDTNLFIRAFRDADARAELERFHAVFGPFEYLSSIVAHELRAGTASHHSARLEREVFAPFERRGRVLRPSYAAWKLAGAVLADVLERRTVQWSGVSRGFAHDVLLAATCREAGVTLLTDNGRDFERIARVCRFSFARPWPEPAS